MTMTPLTHAILVIPEETSAWVEEFFPGVNPCLLPLGNKPYIEFWIDYCYLCGVRHICIVTDTPNDIEKTFGNGSRWNLNLSAVLPSGEPVESEILKRYFGFHDGAAVMIVNGYALPCYQKGVQGGVVVSEGAVWIRRWTGMCVSVYPAQKHNLQGEGGADEVIPGLSGVRPLRGILDFYESVMWLVDGAGVNYMLPGYNTEPGYWRGDNIGIPPHCRMTLPLILGNDLLFEDGCDIGPSSVIGSECVIDTKTLMEKSIIFPGVYAGPWVEFKRKIAFRNRVIDPYSGLILDVTDEFLCSEVRFKKERYNWFRRLRQTAGAFFLFLYLLPLWLLLRPLVRLTYKEISYYGRQGSAFRVRVITSGKRSYAWIWFQKLSLEKWGLLMEVFRGRMALAGNCPLTISPENERRLQLYAGGYVPGVFHYAGMLEHENDPLQLEFDELFYHYHSGWIFNLKMVLKSLIRSILRPR